VSVRSVAVALLVAAVTFACADTSAPKPRGGPPTGSDDERAALAALEQSMLPRAQAARDFDTSRFDQFFVDDPSVPLTQRQRDTLTRIAPGVPQAGYLTFLREFYRHWAAGNEAAKRVIAAQRAGATPDVADGLAAMPARTDPIVIYPLRLLRSDVSAARAYLEAESDPQLFRATLLKVNGRWLVAGENNTPHS
jgi:hypothetical protein